MMDAAAIALLDALIEQQRRAAGSAAVVVGLTDREQLLHVGCYGYADLSAATPPRPETLFEIGSISKSFTAIALLQLWEAGRVNLDAPVSRYLPWFHVRSSHAPITLHHLLSHTAGIIMGSEFSTEAAYEAWALRESETGAQPGAWFHYSNIGYKVLGLVLEAIEGRPYAQIIQRRILDPLGMARTAPAITHETRRRMALGYEPWYDDRPYHVSQPLAPAVWLETATADGSIASTAADMAIYLRMLLNRGRGLLSETVFERLTRPVIAPEDSEHGSHYAYGLGVGLQDGHKILGHSGGMVGYYADLLADMDSELGVIVLMTGPGDPIKISDLAMRVLRAAQKGEPLPAPPPDTPGVDNAADYAGEYHYGGQRLHVEAAGDELWLHAGDERIRLEKRAADAFLAPHPDWNRFLLFFGRQEGQVVEAFWGPGWFPNQHYTGPSTFDVPSEWAAYPGHYRSHNPWLSNFRVLLRKGALALVIPGGEEEPLTPLGEHLFRLGADERSPERIRFGAIIDGRALRTAFSGCDYYRTFTP